MPQITVLQPFKFAHHGYQVEEFEPSDEPRETSDECADIAVREGWAELVVEAKADPAAPENKDAAPKRKTKAAA
jgi:hypothetical protein